MLTTCLIAALTFAARTDEPAAFHIQPYLQWPEHDAITIMWETTEPNIGRVRFGPTPELDQRADEPEERSVHELRLTGLLPETRYFYRAQSGGLTSDTASFRTAPAARSERWRLGVYGDSRSFPDRHQKVAELVARFQPDLVLHTGDQVTRGSQRPQWKQQFFDPAAALFSRVPVLTALGNHEEQSRNYFDYLALPGNEHYFSLDFGNVHIVVLDSNTWGESARESDQFNWLKEDLGRKRETKWTIVAFHHALFSAHDKRSINKARWDWCPLFEDLGVDLVLTGHDHFYYRSWPIGRLGDVPSRGITHITTAGGGAPLYQLKERSYTAVERSVHHATLLDFSDDAITGQVLDITGKVFDEFRLTKDATRPDEFCAYELYELERAIRHEIESRPPTVVPSDATTFDVDDRLNVSHTFRVPVRFRVDWQPAAGGESVIADVIRPEKRLEIPIRRRGNLPRMLHSPGSEPPADLPRMKLTLLDERCRNREIEFGPIKLWRDLAVRSLPVAARPDIKDLPRAGDSRVYPLSRSDGGGAARLPASVSFFHTKDELIVISRVRDAAAKVGDEPTLARDQATLLRTEHVRLLAATPDHTYSFAVSPNSERADARDGDWSFEEPNWSAVCGKDGPDWVALFAVPRNLIGEFDSLKVNFVHANPTGGVEDCLTPTFDAGSDPDRVPDFRVGDRSVRWFAKITAE